MSQFDLDAMFRQALVLQQSGRLEEAALQFEQLLAHAPGHPTLMTCAGLVALQQGQLERANALLGESLAIAQEQPQALLGRGIALQHLGQLDESVQCFDQALALNPQYAEAYANRGNALLGLKRYGEALESSDRALALNPAMADALANRGVALLELNRVDEALGSCDRAIAMQPGMAAFYSNRASILQKLHRLDEALVAVDRAIELDPQLVEAHSNRGCVLQALNRLDEAGASFDRATALKPDYAPAHFNKGLVNLLSGNFVGGWRLYEWRWQADSREYVRDFAQPVWLGGSSLSGKTLLIHAEQGLGDFIMICRYASMAEAQGAKVIIEVPPVLDALMRTLQGNFTIVTHGEPLPEFDVHCPAMSLPLAFGTKLDTIPASVPYLHADPALSQTWRDRLGAATQLRVGLAWSGSVAHKNDHNRSIPLRLLEPWFGLPVEFHALQSEFRARDAEAMFGLGNLRVHGDELRHFADTAALIQEMDLVVAVDTAVAHLAGAMGKPVWILLPFSPDFRWMLGRSDSPWYPGAELFRQSAPGDWASVVADVRGRLEQLLAQRPA